VLLGEDRRGHEHQHLFALRRSLEGGPQRHLRLAVADITADQPVHRPRRLHVGLHQLDRVSLVGRLGEGEALLELPLPVGVRFEGVAAAPPPLGIETQQLPRELLRRPAGACLHRLPARSAQLRERRVLGARSDVAGDLRELVGGDEHAVVALVFEVQVVPRDPRDGARLEAGEARDPVVLVDDDVAGAQVGERAQRATTAPGAALLRALRTATAQQAVLGVDRELQLGATKPSRREAAAKRREGSSGAAAPASVAAPSPSQAAFRRPRL